MQYQEVFALGKRSFMESANRCDVQRLVKQKYQQVRVENFDVSIQTGAKSISNFRRQWKQCKSTDQVLVYDLLKTKRAYSITHL